MEDEEDSTKKGDLQPSLGADLSQFSIHELETRITLLEHEIVRCRDLIAGKRSSKEGAESIFKL